jgi:hypothetical protein
MQGGFCIEVPNSNWAIDRYEYPSIAVFVSFGGWMTNTLKMNAQHPASASVPQKREWKKPVIDILSLEDAQAGTGTNHDFSGKHRSH